MPTAASPLGVLLMAYGTPYRLEDVEPYYTHIRHGRKPTPELLQDLIRRYEAIGGLSPLNDITAKQSQVLEAQLNSDGGRPCRVYLGFKHITPFIADAVRRMAADGIQEAVSLVLAPHYSSMSVGSYQKAAEEAIAGLAADRPMTLWHVDDWHLQPRFIRLLADRVRRALEAFPNPENVTVIFSAHSLPARILTAGDPYERQLRETGEAVARTLRLPHVTFAWQSAGRTQDQWLGPDILDVLRQLAAGGVRDVVVCPAGFVADHLEVLYDIDIEAQAAAAEAGMRLVRTASLNADPEFIRALAEIVRDRAAAAEEEAR